ncbi:MAG: LysR family transcriptional regulator [Granulosicoccus sp.]
MNETNFDWDDLRLFLAVAREGGLAAAANITGKSAPTLGRRMLILEERVGEELFIRLPRGYSLTKQGEALLQSASAIENSISPITNLDRRSTTRRVKISAGTWVTYLLSNHIADLISGTSVTLQFISADHVLDIAHREAIIGIRNQRPTQISLAGRHTNKIRFATYASSKKINTWAKVLSNTPSALWVQEKTKEAPCIEVSSSRNALDMALAGVVKMVLPTFVGAKLENLKQVSDEIEELEHMQWLVTHHEERHVPEVRQVIDRIYNTLASN